MKSKFNSVCNGFVYLIGLVAIVFICLSMLFDYVDENFNPISFVWSGLTFDMAGVVNGVINLLGLLTLVFLSLNTLFELFDFYGYSVPFCKFSENKRKRESERVCKIVKKFVVSESGYLLQAGQQRVSILLSQLGLRQDQLIEVKKKVLDLRLRPIGKDLQEMKALLEDIICSEIVLKDQGPEKNRVYNEVRYYIDFLDIAFYEGDLFLKVSKILAALIKDHVDPFDIENITVAVPVDGNLLLGKTVSEILGCSFIKVREKEKINLSEPWDGCLSDGRKIVIVNDVLVTSNQIIKSLERLESNSTNEILGAFFLVVRKEWQGLKKLTDRMKTEYVLDINDDEIEQLVGQKVDK